MFDWFRDMAMEITGRNSDDEKLKRKSKHEQERKNKIIFSKSTRRMVYILGFLYLIMGGVSLYMTIQIESNAGTSMGIWKYIKYLVLSIIDIAAMICILKKKKKTEIAAFVLVIIFIIFMYISSMMTPFI